MRIGNWLEKLGKRQRLQANRTKGKLAEMGTRIDLSLSGHEVKRTGRGSDYKVTKVDPWTGKRGSSKYIEVKSGNAKLSELQKATQKKNRGRYQVRRV